MEEQQSNNHKEFVGINQLKEKHHLQIENFEIWAKNRNWSEFHNSHYDWWTFPIKAPSSYGFAYSVFEHEINQLKADAEFVIKYLKGVELLMLSWGWEIYHEKLVNEPDKDQTWHGWPIRLHKCANSLEQFGFEKELKSVVKYARYLIEKGISFSYNGKDLADYFKNKGF